MKLRLLATAIGCGMTLALASCALPPRAATKDRLDIRDVSFLKARAPEFVIFAVTADYALASADEGNVSLAMDLIPGSYTLLTEQRVRRGSGSVELLAECKRSERTLQAVNVSLTEYPGGLPRKTFASQVRTVAVPAEP